MKLFSRNESWVFVQHLPANLEEDIKMKTSWEDLISNRSFNVI